CQQYNDLVLTF
nr:immunoglobulin light chain junction region [Macaca mulatta]MOX49337.1 immunoglobulin light chain junction region [Macaca mulatta]